MLWVRLRGFHWFNRSAHEKSWTEAHNQHTKKWKKKNLHETSSLFARILEFMCTLMMVFFGCCCCFQRWFIKVESFPTHMCVSIWDRNSIQFQSSILCMSRIQEKKVDPNKWMNETKKKEKKKIKHTRNTYIDQKPELGTYLNCVKMEKQTLKWTQSERIFVIELPWLRGRTLNELTSPENFPHDGFCLLYSLYWLKYLFLLYKISHTHSYNRSCSFSNNHNRFADSQQIGQI